MRDDILDIITLTTDFGTNEGYVGAMKGRILNILKKYNKDAKIIDISHEIKPFNIYHGAYVLLTAIPYFPPSVHVAVIDPTVGSERKSIVIETKKRVIHIDRFGNIITNIKKDEVTFKYYDTIMIKIRHKNGIEKIIKCKFVKSYFEEKNNFICLINSEGFLEISKFMDNASKLLNVDYLDEIEIIY